MTKSGLLLTAGALALAACDDFQNVETAPTRTASGNAEGACVAAVDVNYGGAGGVTVTGSEFPEPNGVVMLRSSDGTNWRCRASANGTVEELSVTG